MFEQAMLSERFEQLLLKQQAAAQAYQQLLDALRDPDLRADVDQVCRDKKRHIRLSERLLEIVP